MALLNKKARDHRVDSAVQLAGGYGVNAAAQSPEALLRRAVLANLLWEDVAYQAGKSVASEIVALVSQVDPVVVAGIAVEARVEQKLRHVPLLLACECARLDTHRAVVADLLPQIILRPDELTEFLALYWRDGRVPLAASVKRGLAQAFRRFGAYQLAKYNRATEIKLRDVLFLTHAKPKDDDQASTWRQLVEGKLPTPDTWEVALSSGADKKATWERLIQEDKLGGLAFLRNLRNMEQAGVAATVIRLGFSRISTDRLLPLNFFAAADAAPRWMPEIETAMLGGLSAFPKLGGETVLVIDVSGSMQSHVSERSAFSRLQAAAAMAVIAREFCEHVTIWATAGNDWSRTHQTEELPPYRGFALAREVEAAAGRLGNGGIFTRQCLEHIKGALGNWKPDRTIVFSDSQDCDWPGSPTPKPFSKRNYIVDISAHTRGINYAGVWTAEISGWSERFLLYVVALEQAGQRVGR